MLCDHIATHGDHQLTVVMPPPLSNLARVVPLTVSRIFSPSGFPNHTDTLPINPNVSDSSYPSSLHGLSRPFATRPLWDRAVVRTRLSLSAMSMFDQSDSLNPDRCHDSVRGCNRDIDQAHANATWMSPFSTRSCQLCLAGSVRVREARCVRGSPLSWFRCSL